MTNFLNLLKTSPDTTLSTKCGWRVDIMNVSEQNLIVGKVYNGYDASYDIIWNENGKSITLAEKPWQHYLELVLV